MSQELSDLIDEVDLRARTLGAMLDGQLETLKLEPSTIVLFQIPANANNRSIRSFKEHIEKWFADRGLTSKGIWPLVLTDAVEVRLLEPGRFDVERMDRAEVRLDALEEGR